MQVVIVKKNDKKIRKRIRNTLYIKYEKYYIQLGDNCIQICHLGR